MQLFQRLGILAFGLAALLMVFGIVFVGDPDDEGELRALAAAFEDDPSEERLRAILNAPADGAYGYLHWALLGRELVGHEELFVQVSRGPLSMAERRVLVNLAMLGGAIYEHYPELKPSNFEERFQTMAWLRRFRPNL